MPKALSSSVLSSVLFTLLIIFTLYISLTTGAHTASAHEVYVLPSAEITQAIDMPSFDMVDVALDNLHQFIFWAFIGVLAVVFVFFISILRFLERWLDPILVKLRPYAPFVARVTIGLSFLAAAYYQASYGPELPFDATYGTYSPVVTAILVAISIMTVIGWRTRIAATIALAMYCIAFYKYSWYMLNYANYLGEIVVLLAIGAHKFSIDSYRTKSQKVKKLKSASVEKIQAYLAPRSFAILRICFGISLIFASAYAKVIHNNLALFTVTQYHLDALLGFEPHFLVLGAAIVEIALGLFIVFGLEIRFAALFFEFWLVQSLFFFGEAVWPHIILIGIPIALFMYGYDKYSIEGYFFRKKKYEPVL